MLLLVLEVYFGQLFSNAVYLRACFEVHNFCLSLLLSTSLLNDILYLRYEDAILAILYTDLPITTITAYEWLNSLIFHDDKYCIELMD